MIRKTLFLGVYMQQNNYILGIIDNKRIPKSSMCQYRFTGDLFKVCSKSICEECMFSFNHECFLSIVRYNNFKRG